jgi:hypothetical protein
MPPDPSATEWQTIVVDVLKSLGADSAPVPGAKLRGHVDADGMRRGLSLQEFLASRELRFGDFLEALAGIDVRRQPVGDLLVALPGANWSGVKSREGTQRSPANQLRQDVYDTFTRINDRPFRYSLQADRFSRDLQSDSPTVEVPSVTLEVLLEERRAFTDALPDVEQKTQLKRSIDYSANPLGDFTRTVVTLGLGRKWHDFQYEAIKRRVNAWAASARVAPRPEWFTAKSAMAEVTKPQELLAIVAKYMTDDEVRATSVPFRVVEALLSDVKRHRD